MPRFLKTFLLWLMIAALPVQGAAAVFQASCGPRHHGSPVVAAAEGADQHHAVSAPHTHDGADAEPGSDRAQNDEKVASIKPAKLPVSSYCSACSACCAGAAAPPPSISLTPTFLTVEAATLSAVVSFGGFIPAGPERPPRHGSA